MQWAPLHHCVDACGCWCWCGCVCAYISHIHPTCYHLLLFLLTTVSVMSDHICLRFSLRSPLNKNCFTNIQSHTHIHWHTSKHSHSHNYNGLAGFGTYWSSTFIKLNLPDYRYLELNCLRSIVGAIQVALAVVIEFWAMNNAIFCLSTPD